MKLTPEEEAELDAMDAAYRAMWDEEGRKGEAEGRAHRAQELYEGSGDPADLYVEPPEFQTMRGH